MSTLKRIILALTLATSAIGADLQIDVGDFMQGIVSNRLVTVTPSAVQVKDGRIIIRQSYSTNTPAGGIVVLSNVVYGNYDMTIASTPATKVLLLVPDVSGIVRAGDCIVSGTNVPSGSYSASASDSRFVLRNNGTASNLTLHGTITATGLVATVDMTAGSNGVTVSGSEVSWNGDASNLLYGTVSDARIPSTVARDIEVLGLFTNLFATEVFWTDDQHFTVGAYFDGAVHGTNGAGTAGQALVTDGSHVYWSTVAGAVDTTSDNNWTGSNWFSTLSISTLVIDDLSATNLSLISTGSHDGMLLVDGYAWLATNEVGELTVTQAMTLGGVRRTTWPTDGSGSAYYPTNAPLLSLDDSTTPFPNSLKLTASTGITLTTNSGELRIASTVTGSGSTNMQDVGTTVEVTNVATGAKSDLVVSGSIHTIGTNDTGLITLNGTEGSGVITVGTGAVITAQGFFGSGTGLTNLNSPVIAGANITVTTNSAAGVTTYTVATGAGAGISNQDATNAAIAVVESNRWTFQYGTANTTNWSGWTTNQVSAFWTNAALGAASNGVVVTGLGGLTVATSTPAANVTAYQVTSPIGMMGGTVEPEGAVTAAPGTIYADYLGGVGSSLYVKEIGAGNTGWAALGASVSSGTGIATNGGSGTNNIFTSPTFYGSMNGNGSGLSNVIASGLTPYLQSGITNIQIHSNPDDTLTDALYVGGDASISNRLAFVSHGDSNDLSIVWADDWESGLYLGGPAEVRITSAGRDVARFKTNAITLIAGNVTVATNLITPTISITNGATEFGTLECTNATTGAGEWVDEGEETYINESFRFASSIYGAAAVDGSGGVSALTTVPGGYNAIGWVRFATYPTNTVSRSRYFYAPTAQPVKFMSRVTLEASVVVAAATGANLTNSSCFTGIGASTTTSPTSWTDGVAIFSYPEWSDNWIAMTAVSSSRSYSTSAVAIGSNVLANLKISGTTNSIAFTVNGTVFATHSTGTHSMPGGVSLAPQVGAQAYKNDGAALANYLYADTFKCRYK